MNNEDWEAHLKRAEEVFNLANSDHSSDEFYLLIKEFY